MKKKNGIQEIYELYIWTKVIYNSNEKEGKCIHCIKRVHFLSKNEMGQGG